MSDEPIPPIPGLGWRRWLGVLGSVVFAPLFLLIFGSAPSCMGFDEPTLRALEACPASAERLGTPITESWVGMSCGNAKTSGDRGRASWMFPVSGPRGSGSVEIRARRRNGVWALESGVLTTDEGQVDFVACTATGPAGVRAQRVSATVSSSIGASGLTVSQACTVAVIPTGETPQNCRIEVRCGATALYGARQEVGWVTCGADASGGVVARDPDTSSAGGDPTLDLRLGEHVVVLTDQGASGSWAVELRTE